MREREEEEEGEKKKKKKKNISNLCDCDALLKRRGDECERERYRGGIAANTYR